MIKNLKYIIVESLVKYGNQVSVISEKYNINISTLI